jgi:hypothetical protein
MPRRPGGEIMPRHALTIVASSLVSLVAFVDAGYGAEQVTRAVTASGETLKERLSDKASDEQRVDNCHVPPERRGTKPRPADCGHNTDHATAGNEKPRR